MDKARVRRRVARRIRPRAPRRSSTCSREPSGRRSSSGGRPRRGIRPRRLLGFGIRMRPARQRRDQPGGRVLGRRRALGRLRRRPRGVRGRSYRGRGRRCGVHRRVVMCRRGRVYVREGANQRGEAGQPRTWGSGRHRSDVTAPGNDRQRVLNTHRAMRSAAVAPSYASTPVTQNLGALHAYRATEKKAQATYRVT